MRDFEIAIAIKEKKHGNLYSKPILETGYTSVTNAVNAANAVIRDKFGSANVIEITREHRKRRRE